MKRVGRPKGDNNKEKICTIRMDENTMRRLELYCKKMGMLKSQAIREAIDLLTEDEEYASLESEFNSERMMVDE